MFKFKYIPALSVLSFLDLLPLEPFLFLSATFDPNSRPGSLGVKREALVTVHNQCIQGTTTAGRCPWTERARVKKAKVQLVGRMAPW